jgi:hypothetical protein
MKAHIIPQIYLKGFVDPDTPDGQTPFLHLYDFASSSWSRKAPKRTLWQTDFYALSGLEGEEKGALDHGPMSQIEQRAEQLTRKLLALHHPELYQRMAEVYERKTGRKAPTIDDWTPMEEGGIIVCATQYEYLNGMAGVMDVAPDVLGQMQWTFFHTTAPNWLLTSDNPGSLRVPDHLERGFGLRRKDIQILFPISRTMGLLAVWSGNDDHHIDLPAVGDAESSSLSASPR